MSWNLRLAPHLGYRPPFDPQFPASAGSAQTLAQIEFAAAQGFAGVLPASARRWSAAEQSAVGEALARHGLAAGCVLYTTFDHLRATWWSDPAPEARDALDAELQQAFDTARRLGSTRLAILGGASADRPLAEQQATMALRLRDAAERAERAGIVLCIETLNAATVPGMLLHRLDDALAVVRAAAHPAVRLIFDTAHVQAMDGDVATRLDAAWDAVEIVQIADHPGRFEPGTGDVPFDDVFRVLGRRRGTALVELEHGWAEPGLAAEQAGLLALRRLDNVARDAAQAPPAG